MSLDYQLLLQSPPPLTLLVGSAPGRTRTNNWIFKLAEALLNIQSCFLAQ